MIDYRKLADAVEFYKGRGYQYVEVPWAVRQEATAVTKPPECRDFSTFIGNLVASGEQSFIQMMMDGVLPRGRLVCVTPCFRDEDVRKHHQQYFMKVELIYTGPEPTEVFGALMMDADAFYSRHLGHDNVYMVATSDGYDLEAGGVELGSYGVREHEGLAWAYGTGCAEPRLSEVQELIRWRRE